MLEIDFNRDVLFIGKDRAQLMLLRTFINWDKPGLLLPAAPIDPTAEPPEFLKQSAADVRSLASADLLDPRQVAVLGPGETGLTFGLDSRWCASNESGYQGSMVLLRDELPDLKSQYFGIDHLSIKKFDDPPETVWNFIRYKEQSQLAQPQVGMDVGPKRVGVSGESPNSSSGSVFCSPQRVS